MANKGKAIAVLGIITVAVFALVYFGITLTSNLGKRLVKFRQKMRANDWKSSTKT